MKYEPGTVPTLMIAGYLQAMSGDDDRVPEDREWLRAADDRLEALNAIVEHLREGDLEAARQAAFVIPDGRGARA